jgi:hypothetical protein
MTNISNLKKSSKNFDRLLGEVKKMDKGEGTEREPDLRFWKPEMDKAGNALAVIRFLPGPSVDGDDAMPWVRYWDHGFQSETTGKWYIEKSLTSLGQPDPVSEYNTELWNSTTDDNSPARATARNQKRRLHYVSNIYVVSDPKHPENEGKVFLYKYGKKIFDKLKQKMSPDLESEKAVNPFDLWQGADFKLKVTRQAVRYGNKTVNFPNYDESTFLTPAPLFEDDSKLETIWKSEYSLKEFVDPKTYKTYDELKKRLNDVLGRGTTRPTTKTVDEESTVDTTIDETPPWNEDEDNDLAMFRSLAE